MEPRKITIVQTKNQKRSVIESSATTLGELKDDLRTNGIDYEGMAFYEGLTKTELKTDESILPHDIERNGVITNELVFMLTNTEKKIRSGAAAMTRAEAYDAIKKNNLQAECQKMFGKNFTMCKTADLIFLVEKKSSAPAPKKETPKAKKEEPITMVVAPATPATPSNDEPHKCGGCVDTQARAAISRLVDILYSEGTIESEDKDEILDLICGEGETPAVPTPTKKEESLASLESPYTQDEINQMFRGMK